MNASRAALLALASLALSLLLPPRAQADVRTILPTQTLQQPTDVSYDYFVDVAIDGSNILVLAMDDGVDHNGPGTYAALLYRRSSTTGKWAFRRTLATAVGNFARTSVQMKNGIAAVQLGGEVSLFEYANGDYHPALVAAPIRHPGGISISGNRVLIGGDDCTYDAVIYQKGTDGTWGVTGRLADNAGTCQTNGLSVELNYDYALVAHDGGVAAAWRRNGTAFDWVPAGTLSLPSGAPQGSGLYTLQGATAVATWGGYVLRRSGTSTWIPQGQLTSVDHDNLGGGVTPFSAVYRDGVLIAQEETGDDRPRLVGYLETSPGHFEHFASLITSDPALHHDISGRTVVSIDRNVPLDTPYVIEVFTLPTPSRAPQTVVNDFEDRDVSDFTFNSGQFAVATRGTNEVLTQSSTSTLGIALLTDTDWTDYQSIEADITPTFGAGDSWVGLIVRYVDANNYYFAAIRSNATYGIYKRVNGVDTLLGSGAFGNAQIPAHATLLVDGNQIFLSTDNQRFPGVTDNSLTHGRAGLATGQARADFDDVHVTAADSYPLFYRDWTGGGLTGFSFTTSGGDWQVRRDEQGFLQGLGQLDTSGSARAFIGTPVANQEIAARVRLDDFAASQQGAWFGLLARYVDANNHYYVTARSSGQIQIRKIINGVVTVLASSNFTAAPGVYHDLRLRVINDQLQLFVDDALVAGAHDTAIATGQYGMETYRAAATWETFGATQP
jgi:hypothetical protein